VIDDLINRPCTIISRSESGDTDELGNDIADVNEVVTVCEVQQRRRDEPDAHGEVSDTLWDGFFLAGTELTTADAVRPEGLGEFELVGDPWPVRDPLTQQESHVEATLRRVAGAEDADS
jgi:hypothetical protein